MHGNPAARGSDGLGYHGRGHSHAARLDIDVGDVAAECEAGSETHKVISGAIRRRRRILAKIEAAIIEAGIEAGESYDLPPDDGTHA
jgi:hypothetical protein